MAAIVYLVPDLLFASRIRETALQLGHSSRSCRSIDELVEAAGGAALVVLDLGRDGALAALERLAAEPATRGVPTAGFVEHARTEVIQAARTLGCRALSRGKFTTELPVILAALG